MCRIVKYVPHCLTRDLKKQVLVKSNANMTTKLTSLGQSKQIRSQKVPQIVDIDSQVVPYFKYFYLYFQYHGYPFHVDNEVVEWKAMDSPKSPLSMDNDSMECNSIYFG